MRTTEGYWNNREKSKNWYWNNRERARENGMKWRENNVEKIKQFRRLYNEKNSEEIKKNNLAYMNTERGYIMETIAGIFNRAKKKNKRKIWVPEINKKDIWTIVMNHICRMKEIFPESDGRICTYCHKPWTYIRRPTNGTGKRRSSVETNFSLDRWDPDVTYKDGNIVCCCVICNDRKGSSRPKDWGIFKCVGEELKREIKTERIGYF